MNFLAEPQPGPGLKLKDNFVWAERREAGKLR